MLREIELGSRTEGRLWGRRKRQTGKENEDEKKDWKHFIGGLYDN